MILSTKGIDTDTTVKISKFITYGIQELKINKIEVKQASTGSFVCIFNMESPESTIPDFEGFEGAKGKIGRVQFPRMYVKPNDVVQMQELVKNIGIIADKFNVRDQVDNIDWDDSMTIEKYFQIIEDLVKGKFAMWKVCGEKSIKPDGKPSTRLALAKWGFIQTLESYKIKPELVFDKNNKWDFKDIVIPDPKSVSANDDLPF